MNENENINVIDFGSSKIRFAAFDKNLKEIFSKTQNVFLNDNYLKHFEEINNIVKNAEKKISSHIQDIILSLDSKDLFTIDLSLRKDLEVKTEIQKAYDNFVLELNQIIKTNYDSYQILHIIINKCIIDDQIFNELPKNKIYSKNIKIEFKVLCFKKFFLNHLVNNFKKNSLNIKTIICTSYIKSLIYINKIDLKKVSFLEIGWERTTIIVFEQKKLKFIQSIPIGGQHITKDISKIFKISLKDAEKIKKSFNKTHTEFSYKNVDEIDQIELREILDKNISTNLLKKVILYRVQEIIDLSFKKLDNFGYKLNFKDSNLFLIGEGSLLFDNNSFYLNDKFNFNSINCFKDKDDQVCRYGLNYYLNNKVKLRKTIKNQGIFEKFFNLFSR